jgi:hypothetical protein
MQATCARHCKVNHRPHARSRPARSSRGYAAPASTGDRLADRSLAHPSVNHRARLEPAPLVQIGWHRLGAAGDSSMFPHVREVVTLPLASSTWWRSTPSAKRCSTCSATGHRHRVEQTSGNQYIISAANAADIGRRWSSRVSPTRRRERFPRRYRRGLTTRTGRMGSPDPCIPLDGCRDPFLSSPGVPGGVGLPWRSHRNSLSLPDPPTEPECQVLRPTG